MTITVLSLPRNRDYCTPEGARILVAHIRAYWRARGRNPEVWCQQTPISASVTDSERLISVVRSDISLGRVT